MNDRWHAVITEVEPHEPLPGPLRGKRLLVKDLIDTAGIRTTYGSQIYADHVPARTASTVQRLVGGADVVAQARQVFANLGAVLDAAGASFADVVKVTVYLTDIGDRAAINPVRQEVFGETRPASTLVEISALVTPGAKVEIDAVAQLA